MNTRERERSDAKACVIMIKKMKARQESIQFLYDIMLDYLVLLMKPTGWLRLHGRILHLTKMSASNYYLKLQRIGSLINIAEHLHT